MLRCDGYHNELFIESLVRRIPVCSPEGFVYAGEASNGLIKVGKTVRQCPLCRMNQNELSYLGLVWVPNANVFEQQLLAAMGSPAIGSEWFDNSRNRINELIADGWLHNVFDLERSLAEQLGKFIPKLVDTPILHV